MSLYYEICDIIIIPSRSESSGLIALEAASYRKSIIVSYVGGLKEIITNRVNGLTFECEKPQKLCEALIEFIRNENLRSQCSQNLHALLNESYSIKRMVAKTEMVYRKILGLP